VTQSQPIVSTRGRADATGKVLVTGARGLLGSTLVPYLKSRAYEVVQLGRGAGSEVRADLTDTRATRSALDAVRPDVIVNLAALTDLDACERRPQDAYLGNARTIENLAVWIRHAGARCTLVQISTDQVYDGPGPHAEDDIVLSNYYGFSKYTGELSAVSVAGTVLRTNFFGPSRCQGRTSFSDWIVQGLRDQKALTVFDDVRFSPLSLQRLAEVVEAVIARPQSGIFNVGSRDGMSKADFAFTLAGALELPTDCMRRGNVAHSDLLAHRPHDMRLDSSRFEATFGFELPTLRHEIESMKAAYAYATPEPS
jgi:dTDP-4-dehydrorhamnose reductase